MSWSSLIRLFTSGFARTRRGTSRYVVLALPLLCWLVLSQMLPPNVFAQATLVEQSDDTGDQLIAQLWHLKLSPAPEPRPALKYLLRPPYRMLKPGDATGNYYRALLMDAEQATELRKQYGEREQVWLSDSPASLDEMKEWVAKYQHIYNELKIATYREHHGVDLRFRDLEGLATIEFLLPDAQRMRELARMLRVKARIEITEGRLDDAVETLRVGYRLAEAAARTPTLINDLVGIAIGSMMTDELTRLIAHPDAPNMYWAIASLPQPLIDLRDGMDWESGVPWQIFPFLRDAETAVRSAEQWRQLIMDAYLNAHQLSGAYAGKPGPLDELAATALMMKSYPLAKSALVGSGMDRDRVEAMPVGQVVAIHTARSLSYAYDETFKWMYLPSGQVYSRWAATEHRLRDDGYFSHGGMFRGSLPIADALLPGLSQAWFASVRLERQLAALRTIEAIRMYAAAHDNALPSSLDMIDEALVPNDPLFEKPFEYRIEGGEAVIETLPRSEGYRQTDVYRYVIRIAR